MKKFVFTGYSDDTFGECEQTNDDYDNCASGNPIQYELKGPLGEGLVITGIYGGKPNNTECWMIEVSALEEDKPVSWSVSMEPSFGGYKNKLTVFAPEDAVLRCVTRDERQR